MAHLHLIYTPKTDHNHTLTHSLSSLAWQFSSLSPWLAMEFLQRFWMKILCTSTTLMENGRSVLLGNLLPLSIPQQERLSTKFRVSFVYYISGSPEDDSSIDKSETLHCFLTQLAAKQRLTR